MRCCALYRSETMIKRIMGHPTAEVICRLVFDRPLLSAGADRPLTFSLSFEYIEDADRDTVRSTTDVPSLRINKTSRGSQPCAYGWMKWRAAGLPETRSIQHIGIRKETLFERHDDKLTAFEPALKGCMMSCVSVYISVTTEKHFVTYRCLKSRPRFWVCCRSRAASTSVDLHPNHQLMGLRPGLRHQVTRTIQDVNGRRMCLQKTHDEW